MEPMGKASKQTIPLQLSDSKFQNPVLKILRRRETLYRNSYNLCNTNNIVTQP